MNFFALFLMIISILLLVYPMYILMVKREKYEKKKNIEIPLSEMIIYRKTDDQELRKLKSQYMMSVLAGFLLIILIQFIKIAFIDQKDESKKCSPPNCSSVSK